MKAPESAPSAATIQSLGDSPDTDPINGVSRWITSENSSKTGNQLLLISCNSRKSLEMPGESALYTRVPAGLPESRLRRLPLQEATMRMPPVPTCWSPKCARFWTYARPRTIWASPATRSTSTPPRALCLPSNWATAGASSALVWTSGWTARATNTLLASILSRRSPSVLRSNAQKVLQRTKKRSQR